jgi:cytochrome c2
LKPKFSATVTHSSRILPFVFVAVLLGAFAHSANAQTHDKSSSSKVAVPAGLTADARKGRQLFTKLECASCHSIGNHGGCLAPPLDGVSARRSSKYVQLRLGNQSEAEFVKLIGHPELFPHPRFSADTVRGLTAYLSTLPALPKVAAAVRHPTTVKDNPTGVEDFKPHAVSSDSAQGRHLFLDGGCMSCHSIGAQGGNIGPRLDGIGFRHSVQYIESHINNPQGHLVCEVGKNGKSKMPQFDFAPNEVRQIAEFLLTLPKSE